MDSQALAQLFQKHLPKILTYLDLLDRAAAADPLPEAQRAEAAATAHKLAGSLGMYGYQESGELARELEQLLGTSSPAPGRLRSLAEALRRSLPS